MTKLRIISDIHLEFGPLDLRPIGEDVLVLAGDIGVYTDGAVWARDYAHRHGIPVVMIAGNHEHYRNSRHTLHTVASTETALWQIAVREPLLHYLQDSSIEVAGVRFLGSTLWTDFALYGDPIFSKLAVRGALNDYDKIWLSEYERFLPGHAQALHGVARGYLAAALASPPTQPTVVITHHLPSTRSLDPRFAGDPLNPAFASNLDDLVVASGAKLWVHGHTHVSQDYTIGDTRVICNPRGYIGVEVNSDFDAELLIEV